MFGKKVSNFGSKSIAFCGFILIIYLVIDGLFRTFVTQPVQRKQIIADSESYNIETFFSLFGDSIATLANLSSFKESNGALQGDLDAFIEQWRESGLVSGVVVTDQNGITKFNSNVLGTVDVGDSLADRAYFTWLKNSSKKGEYLVGDPVVSRLGASKGNVVIPVVSPIYQNDRFIGAIVSASKIESLTEQYLDRINISKLSGIYLIEKDGNILYSDPKSEKNGTSVFELFPEPPFLKQDFFEKKYEEAFSKDRGNFYVATTEPITNKFSIKLITYSKVKLKNQEWLLILATPARGLVVLNTAFYMRVTSSLVLLGVVIFLFHQGFLKKDQNTLSK